MTDTKDRLPPEWHLPAMGPKRAQRERPRGIPVPVPVPPRPRPVSDVAEADVADLVPADELTPRELDAQAQLEELRGQRQSLSLEVLDDPSVASKLAGVEAEIRGCQAALERVGLARAERSRRQVEAAAAAEAAARAQALDRARELLTDRQKAARAIDSAARKLAQALASYDRVCIDQQRELRAAGRSGGAAALPSQIEAALARAFSDAGVPRRMVELPPIRGAVAPLADSDPAPRLGEPLVKAESGQV